ncbi:MAG: NADPH-dependent oxidoreductase [Alphaproteobacteria bacterium]
MPDVIDLIMNHRSIRAYDNERNVSDADLKRILKAGQMAPNSIHGQQVSVIVVRDKERKKYLAELAGNQPWIKHAPVFLIFVMDYYRAYLAAQKWKRPFDFVNSSTALLTGALDVGLFMQNVINAAESIGLGTVPIGGIQPTVDQVTAYLELPQYVFPLAGLCVGYPAHPSGRKPRLPYNAVVHYEAYDISDTQEHIDDYDEEFAAYLGGIGRGDLEVSWSHNTSNYYQSNYAPQETPTLKKQGFKLED